MVVGAPLVLAMLIGGRGLPALADWLTRQRTMAATAVMDAERAHVSVRALPVTRDSLIARRVRLAALDSSILEGDSPALAGAALAERVSDVAASATTQLGAIQLQSDSIGSGPFIAVRVQGSASGDLASVVRLLKGLESDRPFLIIRELSLTQQGTGSEPGREVLRVEFLVEGLARNRKAPTTVRAQ
jgi:hypothetical protein